jgi:hypothetical protein
MRGFHGGGEDGGRDALERVATEIQRTSLYVKREMRRPIELMVIGGIPRGWPEARTLLADHLPIPLAWEGVPADALPVDEPHEYLYLSGEGLATAGSLPAEIDLFPRLSLEERHPRLGVVAMAAGVVLWLAAGGFGLLHGGGELAAPLSGAATRLAEARGTQARVAATVNSDFERLQGLRREIHRYVAGVGEGSAAPAPEEVLALLSRVIPADTVLLDCSLERQGIVWRCTLQGAVVAADRGGAARVYEALLRHLEAAPEVTLQVSGRQRVPPPTSGRGELKVVDSDAGPAAYPFELRCLLHGVGEG